MSRFGKKDGDGPTAGLKAAVYDIELPDGSRVKKRSFYIHEQRAVAAIYQHQSKWYVAGILSSDRNLWDWIPNNTTGAMRVK